MKWPSFSKRRPDEPGAVDPYESELARTEPDPGDDDREAASAPARLDVADTSTDRTEDREEPEALAGGTMAYEDRAPEASGLPIPRPQPTDEEEDGARVGIVVGVTSSPPVDSSAESSLPAAGEPISRELEERMVRLEDAWREAVATVRDLQEATDALQSEAAARRKHPVEVRVNVLERSLGAGLDAHAAQLAEVQARLARLDPGLASIGNRLASVESRFVSIESGLVAMSAAMEAIRADLASARAISPSSPGATAPGPGATEHRAVKEPAVALLVSPGDSGAAPVDAHAHGPDAHFPQLPAGWQSVLARCGSVSFSGPADADDVDAYLYRVELLRAGLAGAVSAGSPGYRVRLAHLHLKKGSAFLLHKLADAPDGASQIQCRECGDLRPLAFQVFVVVERQGRPEVAVLLPLAPYLFGRYARGVQMLIDDAPDATATVTEVLEPAILAPNAQLEYGVRRKMRIVRAGAKPAP